MLFMFMQIQHGMKQSAGTNVSGTAIYIPLLMGVGKFNFTKLRFKTGVSNLSTQ